MGSSAGWQLLCQSTSCKHCFAETTRTLLLLFCLLLKIRIVMSGCRFLAHTTLSKITQKQMKSKMLIHLGINLLLPLHFLRPITEPRGL